MRHLFSLPISLSVAFCCVCAITSKADAAIIGLQTRAAYDAIANPLMGDAHEINFDGGTGNLTTLDGVTFTAQKFFTPVGLSIYTTNPFDMSAPDDTFSQANYVGSSNFLFRDLTDERITVTFDAATPQNAVGFYVIRPGAAGNAQLIINGSTITSQGAAIPLLAEFQAHFIGAYDDTGANSITSFSIEDFSTTSYFLDSQLRYRVTAVPEPSSLLAMSAVGCFVVMRKRQKANAKVALSS